MCWLRSSRPAYFTLVKIKEILRDTELLNLYEGVQILDTLSITIDGGEKRGNACCLVEAVFEEVGGLRHP